MSYRITFVTDAFKGPEELKLSNTILQIMLDALFEVDKAWLKSDPKIPSIYASGVNKTPKGQTHMRYVQEPIGQEDWKDIPTCIKDGQGDCEDLACWRAAELVVRHGIQARPTFTFKVRPGGGYLYHIIVLYPDGTKEDPSRQLGMGSHLFG